MNHLLGKKVLITGASSGIGRSVALALADKGAELILLARRADRLKQLSSLLKEKYSSLAVHSLAIDINSPSLEDELSKVTQGKVDVLINNAGLALGREKVSDSDILDWELMISTNVTANFKMVRHILPGMLAQGFGDIINMCSVAGHYTYPGGAVYCATKHAVKAFTRVLREETCGKNIRVMQISPGMVNTEFSTVRFKGNKDLADSVYRDMTPLCGDDIARMIVFMLEQPRHVVIDEIITMPSDQGSPTTVHRGDS
jgi:3-hydroxy acid dehydrogenase / malonic semialdehyde reductase